MSLPGPDLINGLFEGVGALFMFRSVRQILKDKQLKGFCWSTCAFFGCWSLYNLFFYPHLNQWASTTGAALMAVANSTYVFLVIYYRHQDHKQDPLRGLSEADKNREFRSVNAELDQMREALRANGVFHTPLALRRRGGEWDEYELDAISRTKDALSGKGS